MLLSLGLLLCLLVVCSFAPGFYFVRKLRWGPAEKLTGAVALSLILLYVAAWGIYCLAPGGMSRGACAAVSVVCLALGILAYPDIVRLFRVKRVRRIAIGFGFLLGWTLLFLATIRHYSGLGWGADWLEHFQRTLFFLHHLPAGTPILSEYQVPSRPPMMNVLGAFFLAQTGDSFALLQVAFTFLNVLLFLPCCLMLPALGLSRRTRILPLVVMFAASPVIFENASYLWTKSLAAFYVVVALWFYAAALRRKDWLRMTAAFVAVSAGMLVHYSAGPYVVFLSGHYAFVLWKRPHKWREVATITVACGLLFGTWFGWSIATYGARKTFQSNTSVTAAQRYQGSTPVRIASNIGDSIVPFVVRGKLHTQQRNQSGLLRDYAFSFFQMNLIFSMGLVGGPLVLWLLYGVARQRPPQWKFWRVLIPACVFIGIAVVGERDRFGSAHLTLIPLEALGLALVASAFPWKRAIAAAVVLGCIADFSLGVWLQARIQSLENTARREVFTTSVSAVDGSIQPGPPTAEGLSIAAWENWVMKHKLELSGDFLQKLGAVQMSEADQKTVEMIRTRLRSNLQDDDVMWGGWWARHQYRLEFLGDAAADFDEVLPPLLLILTLGLMAMLLRDLRRPRVVLAPVKPKAAARGGSRR